MNLENEYIVLGAVLSGDININQINNSNLFQIQETRKLYNILKEVCKIKSNNKDIDLTTEAANYIRTNNIPISIALLGECGSYYVSINQFNSAIADLRENYTKLELKKIGIDLSTNKNIGIDDLETRIKKIKELKVNNFENGTSRANKFLETIKNSRKKYISTGFSKLDDLLGGGIYSGLYVLGAISSLGKTAFIQNIADNIAESGKKVLYFSLEMSTNEMLARTIVRNTHMHDKTFLRGTRELLNNDMDKIDYDKIKRLKTHLNAITDNMYYEEGNFSTTIDEIINKVTMFKHTYEIAPVVVIDYLQIIAPKDIRMTEKQSTDTNIAELKRLSRDLDIPVLIVSSVNRANYMSYIDFSSFKESGSIEYGADVVLGLQLNAIHNLMQLPKSTTESEKRELLNSAKSEIPREIELVVLKNRNGKTGTTHNYSYNPIYNYFIEHESNDILQRVINADESLSNWEL